MHRNVIAIALLLAGIVLPQGLGQEPPQSFDELLAALEATSEATRAEAAAKIAELGKHAGDAVPALVKMLDDSSPDARSSAANALGHIGIDNEAAISALLVRLDDAELRSDDVPVWVYAAKRLVNLAPKAYLA